MGGRQGSLKECRRLVAHTGMQCGTGWQVPGAGAGSENACSSCPSTVCKSTLSVASCNNFRADEPHAGARARSGGDLHADVAGRGAARGLPEQGHVRLQPGAGPGLPDEEPQVHVLPAAVHLLRHLPVREGAAPAAARSTRPQGGAQLHYQSTCRPVHALLPAVALDMATSQQCAFARCAAESAGTQHRT